MSDQPQTELTEEQIASLEKARKALPDLKAAIRKAESAGIDVAQQKKDYEALETQLNKLYNTYVRRIGSGSSIGTNLS